MLTLELVKHHCHIDAGDDDRYLIRLMEMVHSHVESYCNRRIYQDEQDYLADVAAGTTAAPMMMTPDLEWAELTIICHWYANREAVAASPGNAVPMSAQAILDLNRHSSFYQTGG